MRRTTTHPRSFMPGSTPGFGQGFAHGFTLIEILIVVIILGILAAVVIPSFANGTAQSRNAAFVTALRAYSDAFNVQALLDGAYAADRTPGVLPPEVSSAISATDWARPTPIGGQWDWDYGQFGVTAALSVYRPDRTAAEMLEIDQLIDDVNLATGGFRQRIDGYMLIVRP